MEFPIEGLELRTATQDDLKYIVSCVREDVLNSVTEKERELSSTWIDDTLSLAKFSFAKRPMLDEFYILSDEGKDVGMLWLGVSRDQFTMDSVGYVLGIYVDPGHRRKGLGRAMMQCAETWSREKGFTTLTLNVGELNSDAVRFYESLGYLVQTRVMRKQLR